MDYRKKLPYVGNFQQLFPYKEYRLSGGRQEGVRGVDISTTAGLDITLLPDRAMDIYQIRLNGKNLSFISPTGICAPQYYSPHENEFMHNFFAGFLTTCGLSSIGSPSTSPTGTWGMHGRISNTPAERINLSISWEGDTPVLILQGEMREAVMFAENLTLSRQYRIKLGENQIEIRDTVTNTGFRPAGHLILYHFNMGYPLLDEDLQIHIPSSQVKPRNEWAAKWIDESDKVTAPDQSYEERCYYHTIPTRENHTAGCGCFNPTSELGVFIEYSADTLDYFVQWNMFGKGDYALGLETANGHLESRKKMEEDGNLPMLMAGESVEYKHKLHFFSSAGEFQEFKDKYPKP